MTDAEVEVYLSSREWDDYKHSALFHERGIELDRRIASEPLTLQQGAEIMHLPVDVFRHIYGGFLAWEEVKQSLGPSN